MKNLRLSLGKWAYAIPSHMLAAMILVAITVAPAAAQLNPTSSTQNMAAILQGTARTLLSSCGSWPPQVATNPDDQAKNKHLRDATDDLVNALTGSVFNINANAQPYVYNGSFLRLLDSIDTTNPSILNSELLGLGQLIDPSQLNLWGTNLVTMKYDCLSMLGVLAQANANVAIPLASLNAAFKATINNSTKQSSVFMMGSFQSPFDLFIAPTSPAEQRNFAALKAIEWRRQRGITGPAQYISTADFLTVTDSTENSAVQDIYGNLQAGVRIPVVQLKGELSGKLTTSMTLNSNSYITYFWNYTPKSLPSYEVLAGSLATSLPNFAVSPSEVPSGTPINITATIPGWPSESCNQALWTLTPRNPQFGPGQLSMTVKASADGGQSCLIEGSSVLAATVTQNVGDPRFVLVGVTSGVQIPLLLGTRITRAGTAKVTAVVNNAIWDVLKEPTTGAKQYARWLVPIHIDPPSANASISSVAIVPGSISCKPRNEAEAPWQITSWQFSGSPPSNSISNPARDLQLEILLTLQGATTYNDAPPSPPYRTTCTLYGTLTVTSVRNHVEQNDSTDFQAGPIVFPDTVAAAAPVPTNVSASSTN